tara:strand:+ start:723 stop:1352 length:630 start_codon:yes stop_codon:yes gene_type:complete
MPTVVENPKLEAVNVMLSVIGEAPVNSLKSGLADAEAAERILNRVNKEVQTEGWTFNTLRKYSLIPDSTKKIILPSNTLKLTCVDSSRDYPLVQRGLRLYNYEKHKYTIGDDYDEVKVDLVEEIDFNDDPTEENNSLPEYARRYIAIRASRVFIGRYLGSQEIYGFSEKDEALARVGMKQAEGLVAKRSIFDHFPRGEYNLHEAYHRLI